MVIPEPLANFWVRFKINQGVIFNPNVVAPKEIPRKTHSTHPCPSQE